MVYQHLAGQITSESPGATAYALPVTCDYHQNLMVQTARARSASTCRRESIVCQMGHVGLVTLKLTQSASELLQDLLYHRYFRLTLVSYTMT